MSKINILLIDDEYARFFSLLRDYYDLMANQKQAMVKFDWIARDTIAAGKEIVDSSSSIDLIILDLVFKGNTGNNNSFEFLKYLKDKYPHIPVILFSAKAEADDIKKAGFDDDYHPESFINKDEIFNAIPPNYELIYNKSLDLLKRFGRIVTQTGVLITHGTDTMAWAFAILRYGLYNLRTNVVITGSQLPLEGAFSPSDAIGNMLTSVKLLSKLVPPNIIQVFNDGVHIFNKNLVKVKKWSVDAFYGNSFGRIQNEEIKIEEKDVYQVAVDKQASLEKLYFIKTGGTIDSFHTEGGLSSFIANYTERFLETLKENKNYFRDFVPIETIPKDSSYFTPPDWIEMLTSIESTGLSDVDIQFDWKILPVIPSPFTTEEFYKIITREIINQYSGAILLGYGAGNFNVVGSEITAPMAEFSKNYTKKYGISTFHDHKRFSLVELFKEISKHNHKKPDDYKFLVLSSQVPVDDYDLDYEAGRIPLYYGALPSADLSYPEAQSKLAFILGHRELIMEEAKKYDLTYEQCVKSCFLCGVRFTKQANKDTFLRISRENCQCKIIIYPRNVFVKHDFQTGLHIIIEKLIK